VHTGIQGEVNAGNIISARVGKLYRVHIKLNIL
jgi:hypothetical protein